VSAKGEISTMWEKRPARRQRENKKKENIGRRGEEEVRLDTRKREASVGCGAEKGVRRLHSRPKMKEGRREAKVSKRKNHISSGF